MFDPEEMFEAFQEFQNRSQKVVKSLPATEEEVMEMMALKGFEGAAKKSLGVAQSKAKLFWAKVELRTGLVTENMRYNETNNTIEVVEREKTNKSGSDGFPD